MEKRDRALELLKSLRDLMSSLNDFADEMDFADEVEENIYLDGVTNMSEVESALEGFIRKN